MNRNIAFPFLTLPETDVLATDWELSLDGGEPVKAGDYLEDWDASSRIALRRSVNIDRHSAMQNLGFESAPLALQLSVRIGTGQGRLPRRVLRTEYRHLTDPDEPVELQFEIEGRWLSSILDLTTELALDGPPASRSPIAPARRGDRLWRDQLRIRLDGEEPRFPMEVVDLAGWLGDASAAGAPWYLHWSPRDWQRDFHGVLRLYLNSETSEMLERIQKEDEPTLQVLLADVMSQICERLVVDPDAAEIFEHAEPGTLGAQASTWIRHAWPGKSVDYVRGLLDNRPGTSRAAFLSLARTGAVE